MNSISQSKSIFPFSEDIGEPKKAGNVSYDPNDQIYTLTGGGYNIWFNRDEFFYTYDTLSGDFILTANFRFQGNGTDPHRKVGWMIRSGTEDDAAHISAVLHGDGLTVLQWRLLPGAYMRDPEDEIFATKSHFTILQLERSKDMFIMRAAHENEPLQEIGRRRLPVLDGKVLAGLFINSHNADVTEQATAWNVRIDKTVSEDYNPYSQGFLNSRLEVIDVFNGKRKIVHQHNGRFEAPNWMPDGDKLLFNMDGKIYKIPVQGGSTELLNTGKVDQNNNDHGISFNGKLLALSSAHNKELQGGQSAIYVVPIEGGEPELITPITPSYWHGWSPDNRHVVYVAKRNADDPYNIFKADIKTKKETQLTFFVNGHVDGPEYSPDGKYIYYNGTQSGTMQIWRMKTDGTEHEQLTFDERNKWFPHISPDGKWMVFLSFPTSVAPEDHPSYKRVALHLMPANGGESKVIAHLYGGQGTINVPSWSPDSKYVAFVSNTAE